MKATRGLILLGLVMLLAGGLPAGAQGAVNVSLDEVRLDEFPTAKALVTVRNANGVPIQGLDVGQFELVEDGHSSFPPSQVVTQVNADATISIVLVIDVSGSMKGTPIREAIRAANALIDQLSPSDRGAIIAFADNVDLDVDNLAEGKEIGFTTDKNALRNVVNFLEAKIGWDTPLYDAIYKGVKMISSEPAGKRALVVLTDGRDERDNKDGVAVADKGSLSTPDDPINEANRYNIPIFTVGLEGLGGKLNANYLRRVTERTGGVYQETPQPEELTPLFQNVVSQLKQQYVLTYDSRLDQDNQYHSLAVRVQIPQGQGFDERKFSFPGVEVEVGPESPISPGTEEGSSEPGESGSPTPETPPLVVEQEEAWYQPFLDTLKEEPLLAGIIGLGLLLFLALLITLIVVLVRGRTRASLGPGSTGEFEPFDSLGEPVAYRQSWVPAPTDAGPPAVGTPVLGTGRIEPTAWGGPPIGTPVDAPASPGIPTAGNTLLIQKKPQHMAVLVDRQRPEIKYDLTGTTNVGRARTNQIVLDHPTISRQHAWIKIEGDSYLIFDVGSSNGTFVNDERVLEPRKLQSGDQVRFGEADFMFSQLF
ncbi:MAG: FHA domain-containing protein [Anaerolineae bacterium]|nr:FHA domain-containing protein [Anaerolineae bacterium]